jgi:signal transduction histidine kinase
VLESTWINMLHVPIINGLVVNSRDITKRKEMIEEKNRLYEKVKQQHEQLRALAILRRQLAHKIITAQEEERHRVSRELHDEAGQALTVLKLSLEELISNGDLEALTGPLQEKLREAVALCETTMDHIRLLAHDLRPAGLDDLGLNLTLEGYCQDFSERARLPISYSGVEPPELGADSVICLYRFLQEGLTNVAKHASAKHIHVSLRHDGHQVCLQIEDDGRGFDLSSNMSASPNQVRGIGLLGLQERLDSLGGTLSLSTTPGSGTRLTAVLPISDPA